MKRIALLILPLGGLVALLAIFAISLNRDPGHIPSVLINKPAPEFVLPALADMQVPGFDTEALKGQVTVVNVFASWCIPCRAEHPLLSAIKAQTGVALFGINHKDAPENAITFLTDLGNPYDAIGADDNGRVSIEWGVYGVPETFLVDKTGTVRLKHVGPLSPRALEENLLPAIANLQAE